MYALLGNGHGRKESACQGKQPVGADDDIAPVCFSRTGGVEELVFGIKHVQQGATADEELLVVGIERIFVELYGLGIVLVLLLGSEIVGEGAVDVQLQIVNIVVVDLSCLADARGRSA